MIIISEAPRSSATASTALPRIATGRGDAQSDRAKRSAAMNYETITVKPLASALVGSGVSITRT
jgi:hypothetical protein